ncbi:hypothetical protein [Blastopirellula marina]|uniref:Uncharacterized protein n=1 Tax=Blastopirellula marina TaxID=124 RepID=A0A2S8GQH1_9BACT|nr:hypothetical protein [Blastopirellula marina]PQO46611.1 hypothetical protein C5Y93_09085 [Blastopirellula marina]
MNIPPLLAKHFPPSADALWQQLRPAVDNAMLREIAEADYGNRADEMYELLRKIRDRDEWPLPIPGQLDEVLQLTRWCDPDRPNHPPFRPGPTGQPGHRTRLFACAGLFRAADNPACKYRHDDLGSTIAQAVHSAGRLEAATNRALARYLAWKFPQQFQAADHLFLAIGISVVTIRLLPHDEIESLVEPLATWLEELEQQYVHEHGPTEPSNPLPVKFSIGYGFWKPLLNEVAQFADTVPTTELRERWQLLAVALDR